MIRSVILLKTQFKGGLDLKIFEQAEFERWEHLPEEDKPLVIARNALRFLMMGWSSSCTEFISWSMFNAIFIQRNQVLTKALRLVFQEGFEHLFKQLSNLELNSNQHEQVQLYLSNCLSLLPFADLTPYESISVPQFIENKWVLVEYYVSPIELTQNSIQDSDRVFAYGLTAINNPKAQSHLIFMGTTYPAGQGFVPQIDTDLNVFDNVGNSLYQTGRDTILKWVLEQNGKIHACGISLGGALCQLFALDRGEYLERVDAQNPPGLVDTWDEHLLDHWNSLEIKPKVVIQHQANDPVSKLGKLLDGWEYIQVIPPKSKQGPISIFDHFLNYAGFAETEFLSILPEEENKKRKYRNLFIFSFARGLIYYTAIWPYTFLLRPLIHFSYEQVLKPFFIPLAVGLGVALTLSLFSTPLLFVAIGAIITGLLSVGFIIDRVPYNDSISQEKHALEDWAELHNPKLPRNSELNIYNAKNSMELELSYAEINTYYKVMRELVKQKEFIPSENKPFKHNKAFSKCTLLEESQRPELKDKTLPLQLSKAKAITIKRTLALANKIGLDNSEELKQAVSEEYHRYCFGK